MATNSSIPDWRIPTDRGAWRATVHGVTKSAKTEWLSTAQHRIQQIKYLKSISSWVIYSQNIIASTISTKLKFYSTNGEHTHKPLFLSKQNKIPWQTEELRLCYISEAQLTLGCTKSCQGLFNSAISSSCMF